jgi:hypothetical protein
MMQRRALSALSVGGILGFQASLTYPSISLSTPIYLPAGPFPQPETGYRLSLSPGAPLPRGAGLGFLSCEPMLFLSAMVGHAESGEILSFKELVLLFRRRKDSASRTKTLGDFPQAKRLQKPIFDCGGRGCHIISDQYIKITKRFHAKS